VRTTKGTVRFDKKGRTDSKTSRSNGSEIYVEFPKWKKAEYEKAIMMLTALYPPQGIQYTLNGKQIKYAPPMKTASVILATEFIKQVDGNSVMTRTSRKTELWFYPKRHDRAYLLEMGLPICDIDGKFDVDVQQKVPLSQDRTLVPQSYLQDIYAEMLVNLAELIEPGDLGDSHVRIAMEDDRVDAATATRLFKEQFGDNAVIVNPFDADSNQEAARAGAALVSPRTFGAAINAKLREGGIHTTTEDYCRNKNTLMQELGLPQGYKEVKSRDALRDKTSGYTKMLSEQLYKRDVVVKWAQWNNDTLAVYETGNAITFNVMRLKRDYMKKPVSKCSALILHELAHCMGTGHDGIYDHEFERLVDHHTRLVAQKPELYKEFEPELFKD